MEEADFQDDELEIAAELTADSHEAGLEREADNLADEALRRADFASADRLSSGARPALSGPSIHESASLPDAGSPLPPAIREEMERAFDLDLSKVRVHVGAAAERHTREFNADAYTLGSHIVFGEGRFAPDTQSGKRLLAHELAHVLQQSRVAGSVATSTPPHVQKSPRTVPKPEQESLRLVAVEAPVAKRDSTNLVDPSPPPVADTMREPSVESIPPPQVGPEKSAPKMSQPSDERTSAVGDQAELESGETSATQGDSTLIGAPGGPQDETSLPRLADLLPAREKSLAGPTLEQPNLAPTSVVPVNEYFLPATADDVKMLVEQLRNGSNDARRHLSSEASKACAALDRDRTKADDRVDKEKERADYVVEKALEKRRSDLERTLEATRASIGWQEGIRKKEAETHGSDAKLEMAWTVSKQRGRMERAVEKWVGYIDTLRDFHIERIKHDTAMNVPLATGYAELYDRTFLQTGREPAGRVQVQREATVALAKALAEEFKKMEPEAIKLTRETTAEMAGKIHEFADQTYAEFDKTLPQLLNGIDDQVAAAKENIAQKARDARTKLDIAATKARDRLKEVETSWYARNISVATQVKDKITTVHDDSERRYRNAVSEGMQPISTVVDEAIQIVSGGDPLDIDASWQFVGEVTGFAIGASESVGDLFVAASAGIAESFERPGPAARRALAAEKTKYTAVLQEEGAEQEFALIEFESAVDASYATSITTLDETFEAARIEAKNGLSPYVDEFLALLENNVMKSAKELRRAVDEPLFKQSNALERLRRREMRNVALQAAWRYEHSVLKHVSDALDWIAEKLAILFVAITIILAVILLFKLAVAVVALAFGAFVAKLLVGLGTAIALIYFGVEAYQKRIEEGASPVGAFFGALGEVTGVIPVYRALTDSSLSIADRGVLLGFGALSVFGTAMAAGRLFRAVKLRFPAKITDPRISVATEPPPPAPQVGLQPKQEFTVRGFQPQGKQIQPPTPVETPTTTSPSTGGYARPPGQRVPVTPEPPPASVQVKPEFTVRGFQPQGKQIQPRSPVEAPTTTSPSTGGFARAPGERVPIAPEGTPPPASPVRAPAPQEVPSPAPRAQGAQSARASAAAAPENSRVPEPAKGKVEPVTEPTPATPETAPPAGPQTPRQSKIIQEADSRLQEVRKIETTAKERAEKAAQELAAAEEELQIAKELRKSGQGDRNVADEFIAEQNKRVRDAKKENRDARKSLERATTESEKVVAARERINQLEKEIADVEAKLTEAASDTSTQFRPVKGVAPPTATTAGKQYRDLRGAKGRGHKTLAERREDLYRSLADHVARLTPGEKGKPLALENARKLGEEFPEIAPEGDVPIDVMTGKPIKGEWATDHLMSRSEIAKDPRFKLLDPAGRVEILQNVPENYLPLTPAANSSKLNRTVAKWLAALGRKTPIDTKIAKALRKADELARIAVEKKFQDLLAAMGK